MGSFCAKECLPLLLSKSMRNSMNMKNDPTFLNMLPDPTKTPNPASVIKQIVATMLEMSEEERMEIMGSFCRHCGSDDPRCVCWNDE